jgi:catechol 2,3-dioxygenase-like lactoylglutathione lyase family enzyme
MEPISTGGVHHFALTVTDRDRSRDFYVNVLGFQFLMEFGPKYLLSNGTVILALNPPPDPERAIRNDSFDESRVGLDHISLNVNSLADLQNAVRVLDEKGIRHGQIKDLGGVGISVLALRDPDNIQVELTAPNA